MKAIRKNMKVISLALAVIAGGSAMASSANAGWMGNQIGNFTYWNNSSTGQSITCTHIGRHTFC